MARKPQTRVSAKQPAKKSTGKSRWVYPFGGGKAAGKAGMRNLLGGKGAGLAEMANLGLPVPPGFTITTEVCTYYYANGNSYPRALEQQVKSALADVGRLTGKMFGDKSNPLLVSVRSGARASMPGMMDTVLNLGLNDETVEALAKKSGDRRFAYDSYRRFITMYSDVVLGVGHHHFEEILDDHKDRNGYTLDTDLTDADWEEMVGRYKERLEEEHGEPFPQDPFQQLWGAISAVFSSWMNQRAITYRRLHNIPESWGTAVNVQAMVFGNMGETSATGVAFTRNPSTGEKTLYGEFLINAQGEDVVAGIRTPQEITEAARQESGSDKPSMEKAMPSAFKELTRIYHVLEKHYRDMQDLEFTVEQDKLWMLQTRSGKRTAKAALRIAVELANEGLISRKEAVTRVDPAALDQLLHPTIDPNAERKVIATGLPASPGAAAGEIVFSADDAETMKSQGKKVILVRVETSPEDIHGMHAAEGILTTRGGMTSHAAVVARGMGKPCVSGAGSLRVDYKAGTMTVAGQTFRQGDFITVDGSTGQVLAGRVAMIEPAMSGEFETLMGWADEVRKLGVRANADTPNDARVAVKFGAEGIGLCRTEHMFFDEDRIRAVREMILADDEKQRRAALAKLLPMQREDFVELFEIMGGLPVTIRLLDPPLHEFLPHTRRGDRRGRRRHGRRSAQARGPCERTSRVQSDARLPRLPPRDRLPGDRRDAGARDLRGRGRGGEEHRQDRRARGDGAADRHQGRARSGEGTHRRDGGGGCERDRRESDLSGRHHDRAAARIPHGRRDRRGGGVLLVRHQRPDADLLWDQPRRCRKLPRSLHRARHSRGRPVRVDRPRRRRRIDAHRRRARAQDAAEAQGRHLRRARRRSVVGRVLPSARSRLCVVLAVPRADCALGGGAGRVGQGRGEPSVKKARQPPTAANRSPIHFSQRGCARATVAAASSP